LISVSLDFFSRF